MVTPDRHALLQCALSTVASVQVQLYAEGLATLPFGDLTAPVLVDADAEGLLREYSTLVNDLAELLTRQARRSGLLARPVWVTRFIDPDEGTQELVVTQRVDLEPTGALEYWDTLGSVLDAWAALRSPEDREALSRSIAVDIMWA